MTLRRLIFAFVVASSAGGAAAAQSPVVSVVSVIDGVTIEIHGQPIRLDDLVLVDEIVSTCPPAARAAEYEQIPQ
jgi:endonuclease YncB( thermonuclease family)